MPVGPFYSSDILSGPLASPMRGPMLQSASEHGRNQSSSTAMRESIRVSRISNVASRGRRAPPERRFRVVASRSVRRVRAIAQSIPAIDPAGEFNADKGDGDGRVDPRSAIIGAGGPVMAHKGNYSRRRRRRSRDDFSARAISLLSAAVYERCKYNGDKRIPMSRRSHETTRVRFRCRDTERSGDNSAISEYAFDFCSQTLEIQASIVFRLDPSKFVLHTATRFTPCCRVANRSVKITRKESRMRVALPSR